MSRRDSLSTSCLLCLWKRTPLCTKLASASGQKPTSDYATCGASLECTPSARATALPANPVARQAAPSRADHRQPREYPFLLAACPALGVGLHASVCA